jgi:hypothetical protein
LILLLSFFIGDCYANGQWYNAGDTYKDDCNTCFCGENGLSGCTLMACPPGDCYVDGVWYQAGDNYMDDCNTCICMEDGGGACTRMFCGYSEK